MTLDELKKESFYQQLTDGQKTYVVERCQGKNRIEAAKTAWTCKDDASARAMANKREKNANVTWLINKFLGVGASRCSPDIDELRDWLWEKSKGCDDPKVAYDYVKLFVEVSGYKTKPTDPAVKPPPSRDDSNDPGIQF